VAFAQSGGAARDTSNVRCYNCQEMGHLANECPLPDSREQEQRTLGCTSGVEEGQAGASGFSFSQASASSYNVPKSWIILDNGSTTIDMFCNKNLLKNIRMSPTRMNVHGNGGKRQTIMIGDLTG